MSIAKGSFNAGQQVATLPPVINYHNLNTTIMRRLHQIKQLIMIRKPFHRFSFPCCKEVITVLVCLFISGSTFSQLVCKTGCTSNDVQIKSAFLAKADGSPLDPNCVAPNLVTTYLWLELTTNTPRVGVSITATIEQYNGAFDPANLISSGPIGECFSTKLSVIGSKVRFNNPVQWTCGANVRLTNVFLGWGTGNTNFCTGTDPQCPGTPSKCYRMPPGEYTVVQTFPCSEATITSQPLATTKCEGLSASFSTSYTGGSPSPVVTWERNSGTGFSSFTIASPYSVSTSGGISTLTINPVSASMDNYEFRTVLTSNTSDHNCITTSNSAKLDVDLLPTTASVGSNQNRCGLTSAALGGNDPSVGTGTWTKQSGPTGATVTFSNASSGSSTATVSTYGTYVFRWTISNGTCTPSTADITVNYYEAPTTASVGSNQNRCSSLTSAALGGNDPSVGTGTWTKQSGPTGATVTFSNASSGSSTATVSTYGTYVFRWTISNGTCTPSTADITVNYYEAPTTASVGSNQNRCGLTSAALGGNDPSVGTGTWTKQSGPTGATVTFSNASSGSSTATVSTYGTYVFRWTISNGTCTPSTADITVNYYEAPTTASVGSNQNRCGLTSAALGGNDPSVGTGTWTKQSGPTGATVTFSNASSGSSTATVSTYGTYVFRWTISNGTCTPSTADITVNYYEAPTTASVGSNQNRCSSLTSAALGGNDPSVGTGTWTKQSGPTGATVTFSNASSGSSTATVSTYGTYVFRWTISNGTCTPSTADITVNYYETLGPPSVCVIQPSLCGPATGKVNFTNLGTGYQYSIDNGATWKDCNVFNPVAPGAVTGLKVKTPAGCISSAANCNTLCTSDPQDCPPPTGRIAAKSNNTTITDGAPIQVKAYPNPFHDKITFVVTSPVSGKGSLDVYNSLGQKIRTVYQGNINKGNQNFELRLPQRQVSNLIYVLNVNGQKVSGKILQVNQ